MIWLLILLGALVVAIALARVARRLNRRAARDIETHIQQALEIVR